MKIWCCGCGGAITARLTTGSEIYPHRSDLSDIPFWKCDHCGNFVGCHHKTQNRTKPLGCIPTPEIRNARQHIHRILDPIWKSGAMTRSAVYAELAKRLGIRAYHTSEIATIEDARRVYRTVLEVGKVER